MEDTGWSRQWVYGGLSLGIFISGLLIPRCGDYVARHGGRGMLAWSGIVTAAGLLLMACSTGLPAFIAAWVILGGAMADGLYDALYATLGDSYGVQAKSAITTITLISGFAPPLCGRCWPLAWRSGDGGTLASPGLWFYWRRCGRYIAVRYPRHDRLGKTPRPEKRRDDV